MVPSISLGAACSAARRPSGADASSTHFLRWCWMWQRRAHAAGTRHATRNAQRATRTLSHVTQGRGEEQAIEERVFEREIKAAAPEQDDFLGGDGHGGQPRLLARAPLAGGCPLAAQSSARLQHPPREDRTTARAPHRAPRPSNVLSQQGQKRKLVRIIVNLAHLSLCSAQSCGQPE